MEKVRGLRILLVENDEMNIKFVKIVLDRLGHKTDIAVNGQLGIGFYKKNKYDLILMDLEMPEMNGLDATIQIREYEAANNLPPVKIIAVTAYAMETDRQSCFDAGMDNFLAKPFLVEELTDLIEKYFNNNKELSANQTLLNRN
ncbi:MAG: response regulator [Chlorobi bacterium]|nr:response regulator [Chlorobiota bacterium]